MSARPNSMSSRRVVAFIMKPTKQYQDQSTSFGKHRKSFPLHEHQSADSCHGVTGSLAPWHLFTTFASRLTMEGVDLLTIKEPGVIKVQRYADLHPSHRRSAIERLVSRQVTVEKAPPAGTQ